MPIITKISVQEKNKDRYNIFLDEKYALSVDEDILIKHQLKKGIEVDAYFLSEIAFQDDIRKAYNKAIQYLARRMRSEQEVRQFLKDKDIDELQIQEVIHKLYEYRFLDDCEFAIAFVRTAMNTSDKGSGAIRMTLREKGISEDYIEFALKEFPYEKEYEKALQLCEKFFQKNSRDSAKMFKQKLEQLLYRKGYRHEIIQAAMAETQIEKNEEEEMSVLRPHAQKAHRKFSNLNDFEYEQKMKQTLYRKGFRMELIEMALNELKEEE